MAELLHRPLSEEAHRLTDALLDATVAAEASGPGRRKRGRTTEAIANLHATIAALVHDLLRASTHEASEGWCFRPEGNPDFTGTQAAARQYGALREAWTRLRFMERVGGIRHGVELDGAYASLKGKAAGRAPRLRATPKLLALAADHGVTPETLGDHFERSHDTTYPVILRRKLDGAEGRGRGGKGKTKESVRFPRTAETDRIAEEVRALNAFLDEQTFEPPLAPRLVAIFGEDKARPGELAWGGRLTSTGRDNYQGWPSAQRRALRINGEPVAEIDIKASHLTIFLARQGVHVTKGQDPYAVPGVPRLLVKRLVTAFFGNGHLTLGRWPRGLAGDYKAETGRTLSRDHGLRDTVARIIEAVPTLRHLPSSGLNWGVLQRIEADILRTTLTRLHGMGIPALPVHDSLIVPERGAGVTQPVLQAEFQKATGAPAILDVKRPNSEAVG